MNTRNYSIYDLNYLGWRPNLPIRTESYIKRGDKYEKGVEKIVRSISSRYYKIRSPIYCIAKNNEGKAVIGVGARNYNNRAFSMRDNGLVASPIPCWELKKLNEVVDVDLSYLPTTFENETSVYLVKTAADLEDEKLTHLLIYRER